MQRAAASSSASGQTILSSSPSAAAAAGLAAARLPARRRSRVAPARAAFVVGGNDPSSGLSGLNLIGGALTALAGAAWLQHELQQQERMARESLDRRPCPACEGRGYEPCMCARWSDGDAGCGTCRNTGYMACRSCRGGGTAVPIKATIPVREQPRE